jgi:hypothetical protein
LPESVTQKAGPTPEAVPLAFNTASVDANIVDIKAPIEDAVPFPPETPQPETTCLHLAEVAPAFVRVDLEKFSTRESKAFSLEATTFILRFFLDIMQLYLQ